MELESRLRKVFIRALNLDEESAVTSLVYRKTPFWDSLSHMRLVAVVEEEFDVRLSTDQIIDMSSFPATLSMLTALGCDD